MRRSSCYILTLITLMLMLVGITACDVHEFPHLDGTPTPVVLRLQFETDLPVWDHYYKSKKNAPSLDELSVRHVNQVAPSGNMHYIVRATSADGQTIDYDFTRNVVDGYNCNLPMELPAGQWEIRVWADLHTPELEPFYDATDFNAIERMYPHVGNTDYADAFRGTLNTGIHSINTESDLIPDTCVIAMQRPLAKYEFVSNDLQEFMSGETVSSILWGVEGKGVTPTDAPDFSRLDVRIFYPTYMPSVYNMSTDKPIDSSVGRWFPATITMINQQEASVGFDYVMVNGHEAVVTVQIAIFSPQGEQISLTPPIDVPLLRSMHTIMRGAFLTINSSSGLSIDPDYDGDINLWLAKRRRPPLK